MSIAADVIARLERPVGLSSNARTRLLAASVLLADVAVLSAAVLLAWDLRLMFDVWVLEPMAADSVIPPAGPWLVPAWVAVLAAQGAYLPREFGHGPAEFRAVAWGSLLTAGLLGLFCYLVQMPLSRGFVVLAFAIGAPALMLERYAARKILHLQRSRGRLVQRVVVVGAPSGIEEVQRILERESYTGYQVIGACRPDAATWEAGATRTPILGSTADIREICRQAAADTVLVTRGGYDGSTELRRIAWSLEGSDVDLVVVPSLTDIAGPRISMRPVAGLPLLHVEQPQAGAAGGLMKRAFDVVMAGLALVVLSPVLLAVALAVKGEDGGPVLFRQRRIGRTGQPFDMLKFRSMVCDAEQLLPDLLHHNESDGVLFKIRQDPRITRVGRFIRRYSLDELPQLVNVLRGDMSLVGPRPPLPVEVEKYHDDVHRRLVVRPGLTGLWQVSGRASLSWDETVRLDLFYVDNWSMTFDLLIMAKTVRAVLGKSGAY